MSETRYNLAGSIGILIILSSALLAGCNQQDEQDPVKVFLSAERIDSVRTRIEQRKEPQYSAYLDLKEEAESLLDHTPTVPDTWFVPFFYQDSRGHQQAKKALMDDANTAYKLALMYQLTGQEKYARSAVPIIKGWSTLGGIQTEEDSKLSFSYHYPALIFAADMVRSSPEWTGQAESNLRGFLVNEALQLNTMDRHNNWGNWGLALVLSVAAYVEDEELMAEGYKRWEEFIDTQVGDEGQLPHEITRNNGVGERGIWYSHFTLMPQTIAAEIACTNGLDLYDYTSEEGRTLQMAYHTLAPWAMDPSTFPHFTGEGGAEQRGVDYISYFEVLNTLWPNDASSEMLQRRRPLTASHSTPVLTLTHGDLAIPCNRTL
ncbi:MAG: alginate lyase family protein [Balneolales bacterium]